LGIGDLISMVCDFFFSKLTFSVFIETDIVRIYKEKMSSKV
jgi:hypothetical protein